MRAGKCDLHRLHRVRVRLGDAVVDPAIWPEIMEEICAAVSATGAVLLQGDVRTPDVPRTAAMNDVFATYFRDGWHARDLRAARGVPLLARGQPVITDQDLVTPEEMRREPFYNEGVRPLGLEWFAAIGFWAGSALWGLCIQRTAREGPFEAEDKRVLAPLSRRLTEIATLSAAVGRAALKSVASALALARQPALILDRAGSVIDANAGAQAVFGDEIRLCNRRLRVRDKDARIRLDALTDRLRITSDTEVLPIEPIVVRRDAKRPVVIRALPIDGAARSPFLGARALLILSDLERTPNPAASAISRAFGLTPAEARLASLIGMGMSPEMAAEELGIARETARNQLKAIFVKTETHRQSELVALLGQCGALS